jgi:thermolabile hemolysin
MKIINNISLKTSKFFFIFYLFALLIMDTAIASNPPVTQFTKLFVIGDSLSDQYRMGSGLIPYCPNPKRGYWDRRFSNGYLWIDYLVQDNQGLAPKLQNYAVGGAEILNRGGSGIIGRIRKQAEDLVNQNQSNVIANSMVIIWGGSNDIKEATKAGSSSDFGRSVFERLRDDTIEYLENEGVQHFVLVGVPRLDLVPLGRTWSAGDRGWSAIAVNTFNTELENYANQNGHVFVDIAEKIIDVFDGRITSVNMTDLTNQCHNGPNCVEQGDTPGKYRDRPCEGKMFFDKVHPTTAAHCGIAKWMEQAISTQYDILGGDKNLESCSQREQTGKASWGFPINRSKERPIHFKVQTELDPGPIACQSTCYNAGRARWTSELGNITLPNNQEVGFCGCDGSSVREAEFKDRSFNTRSLSVHAGHSGEGFEDFQGINGYVEWDVDVLESGQYDLDFGYAASTSRPSQVTIDGQNPSELPFLGNGSWTNWQNQSVNSVYLNRGTRKLRVTANNSSGPNLDHMTIETKNSIKIRNRGSYESNADFPSFSNSYTVSEEFLTFNAGKLILTVSGERDRNDSSSTFSSVTFGGVTMIKAAEAKNSNDSNAPVAIFYLDNPPSIGNVVVNTSGKFNDVHSSWISVDGLRSDFGYSNTSDSACAASVLFGTGEKLVVSAIHNNGGNVPILQNNTGVDQSELLSSDGKYSEAAAQYQILTGSFALSCFSNSGPDPITLAVDFD